MVGRCIGGGGDGGGGGGGGDCDGGFYELYLTILLALHHIL